MTDLLRALAATPFSSLETGFRRMKLGRWLRIIVPILIIAVLIQRRAFLTPDVMFILLLAVFIFYGMALQFIKMFMPFVFLLVSYDGLRGLVPFISHKVHFREMIDYDRWLGGGELPNHRLQALLYHGHLNWYDFYFYGLYMMHFVVPLLVAVMIWRLRPWMYWQYVWSFVVLSYSGFITYLLYPAAPPWMASEKGLIPPLTKISTDIWFALGVKNFPTLYEKFSPNLVAAVPSLHAAYPTLVALFVWRLFGWKKGLLTFIYPLSVWVGIVYMGEHYVVDALLGILYALVAYLAVDQLMKLWRNRKARQQPKAA
jgi:hypothetical protein